MPYSGPLAPPTVETSVMPIVFRMVPMSLVGDGRQLLQHRLEAAVHVDAVIGVADRRVERRQVHAFSRVDALRREPDRQ